MQRLWSPLLMVLFALALPTSAAGQGTLIVAATEEGSGLALGSVEVTIRGADRSGITGADGRVRLPGVTSGTWVVEVRAVGYRPVLRADVVVRDGRTTTLAVALASAPVELDHLVVRPDLFAALEDPGATGFAAEEIRRAPGAAGDVSRIVQSLPSIARVNDQSNGLIVRGGAPQENLILVDGIEIPNISHFPVQGSSGGAISILDVDLVRELQFSAGGFGARYGDRLSSVLDIRLREGNRERLEAQFDLDFVGLGGAAEGPLGSRGSWVVSGRRSWLDLLVDVADAGSAVAPTFDHVQGKVTQDLGKGHHLRALGVTAGDQFETDLTDARRDAMLTFGDQDLRQSTVGAGWDAIWTPRLRSSTTVAWGHNRFNEIYFETASDGGLLQRHRTVEDAARVRHATTLDLGRHQLRLGGDAVRTKTKVASEHAARVDDSGQEVPALVIDADASRTRVGGFVEADLAATDAVTITVGVRTDRLDAGPRTTVSPRAAVTWQASGTTTLRASGGIFHQDHPTVLLTQSDGNRTLRPMRARHAVLGVQHRLQENLRLSVEAYGKWTDRLAVDPAQPDALVTDELFRDVGIITAHPVLTTTGESRAYGIEATLQQRLAHRTYGMLGAALFRSEYRTPGSPWRPRAFDNRALLTAEAGWRATDRMTLSARWVVAGGAPTTPIDEVRSAELGRTVLDTTRRNGTRMPAYHALNVRADWRARVGGTSLTTFLSVWNAYDRANVQQFHWNTATSRVEAIRQWGLLPIFGIEWEL